MSILDFFFFVMKIPQNCLPNNQISQNTHPWRASKKWRSVFQDIKYISVSVNIFQRCLAFRYILANILRYFRNENYRLDIFIHKIKHDVEIGAWKSPMEGWEQLNVPFSFTGKQIFVFKNIRIFNWSDVVRLHICTLACPQHEFRSMCELKIRYTLEWLERNKLCTILDFIEMLVIPKRVKGVVFHFDFIGFIFKQIFGAKIKYETYLQSNQLRIFGSELCQLLIVWSCWAHQPLLCFRMPG